MNNMNNKKSKIESFTGDYAFLSNAYNCKIEFEGLVYNNADAAYEAQKCLDKNMMNKFTRLSSAKARAKGRNLPENEEFEYDKVNILYKIVLAKFKQNEDLKRKLLDTGDAELINDNTFRDEVYGVYNGRGMNILGKTLELVRSILKIEG